ncbi:MAG: hypothetical protein SXA11_16255 [Cyanobacteriota bacterium]|nr:hypothetical protein [Cyanobacteriota bacterium]
MSFAHLRINKLEQDNFIVEYLVESFDFNEEKEWEKVGKLVINTAAKNYEFQAAKIWIDRPIIPPEVFRLDETERQQVIQSQYRDYGWGAWSILIHHWAVSFIQKESFPEYHPLSFFPEKQQLKQEKYPASTVSV